jgi:hypothetical protein
MGIGQLCKNIEGDPAKPGLAATTCWRPIVNRFCIIVCWIALQLSQTFNRSINMTFHFDLAAISILNRNKRRIFNFTTRIGRDMLLGAYPLFDTPAEQKSDVPTEQTHE